MRKTLPDVLERARVTIGQFASPPSFGPYGMFELRHLAGDLMRIVAAGADYARPRAGSTSASRARSARRTGTRWPT